MRAAIIENDIVVNIIKVDSLDGYIDATGGKIGDGWDGVAFYEIPLTPEEEAEEADRAAKEARKVEIKAQTKSKNGWQNMSGPDKDAILEHYAINNDLV